MSYARRRIGVQLLLQCPLITLNIIRNIKKVLSTSYIGFLHTSGYGTGYGTRAHTRTRARIFKFNVVPMILKRCNPSHVNIIDEGSLRCLSYEN